MQDMVCAVFAVCLLLILYHHLGYPWLLALFSGWKKELGPGADRPLNAFTFVIPMHNEAHFIAKKIANLAALDYPKTHYSILLLDDGSSDNSLAIAREALAQHPDLVCRIHVFPHNQGKVAVFNQAVPEVDGDQILFFSDVSSTLSKNVLAQANRYFNNPVVGAYCPIYRLKKNALTGEITYWDYQTRVYYQESKLGSSIGYHGSGYAIRRSAWAPVPADAINDDFIIPLRVIGMGYKGIYDLQAQAIENERSTEHHDWHRRIRIAAGNIQQLFLLKALLLPQQGFIAWMFFSGKTLRTLMPWLLVGLWCSSLYLALRSFWFFAWIFWAQTLFYGAALLNVFVNTRLTSVISYFVLGQTASLLGWFYWYKSSHGGRWRRASSIRKKQYVHPIVYAGKWVVDRVSGLLGVLLFVLVYPFVGLAIKLFSPGPVLYRQLRVGITTDKQTQFFFLYKFRTMHVHAKSDTQRWTQEHDPRISAIGNFLRKTHLDELPQFYNVLKGDMSLIGPRPERPSLFPYITKETPFYAERLFWVKPGLTGLAQVTYRYDKTIEDVRKKVACDHAYATFLTKPSVWFRMEVRIIVKTISLVLRGKGL